MSSYVITWLLIILRYLAFFVVFRPMRGYARGWTIGILSGCCGIWAFSLNPGLTAKLPNTGFELAIAVLWQIATGILFAAPFALFLESVVMSGRLLDTLRGAQTGEQLNPALAGVVSNFENAAALFFFSLVLGGGYYEQPLRALSEDLSVGFLPPRLGGWDDSLKSGRMFFGHVQVLLHSSILWVGSIVAFALIVEVGSGFVGRMLPRVAVSNEFVPLKLLLGLLLLLGIGYLSGFHVDSESYEQAVDISALRSGLSPMGLGPQ